MRPLRFCFLTTFYPPYNFGGDGIGVQRLARGLARRGHHVTVIHDVDAFNLLHDGPAPEPRAEADGIEVVRLESGLCFLSPLLTQQSGRPVVNGPRIRRILAEGEYDVVNFHNVSLVGGPGILSYGGEAVTLYMAHEHWLVCPMHVLWRHGRERCDGRECVRCSLHYRRPPQLHRFTGYHERQLQKVDTFIAMSEFSRDKHQEFGFEHEMEVLPYFIPYGGNGESGARSESSPHERPYFLFVGRLEKIKGLQDVIPVFRENPGADLLIAGSGEYRETLEEQAGESERIRFLGRIPLEELERYYRHALALIVPSICFETFGIILIEAFRYGTPVIARNLGPFPEIVQKSGGGELFETREELVAAMERMINDPQHRDRLARQGHRSYRELWVEEAVIPRYLEIVRDTARKKGREDVLAAMGAMESI